MRATVAASDLTAAMKHSVAARTSPLAIVQHALLTAEGGTIKITTTDMEATVSVVVPATVEEPGDVCALAGLIASSCALGNELRLDEAEGRLRVRGAGRSVARIPALPARDFPVPDDLQWKRLAVDPISLRAGLARVGYAAGKNDVRYYLNVVHLANGYVEASDGHRAARYEIAYDGPKLLIPSGRVPAIRDLLDESSVIESIDGRRLRVSSGTVAIETSLVDGQFPELVRVMPATESERQFSAPREAFVRAVASLAPFSRGSAINGFCYVRLRADDGAISLTDKDGNSVDVDDGSAFGESVDMGIDVDYLRDAAATCGGSSITFAQHGEGDGSGARLEIFGAGSLDRHLLMGLTQ